jgi:general bacterial porin, GBP family
MSINNHRESKKSLIALGAAVAFGAAAIWSNAALAEVVYSKDGNELSVYGVLDVGFGTLEHSYSSSSVFISGVNPYNLNSSPNSFTGLYGSGISMSRVGIQGSAALGNDWKAFFKVESAVNVLDGVLSDNGQSIYNDLGGLKSANGASAINGQAFQRAAYVGVSQSRWGSLELGRTTNFSLDQVTQYDPVQAAYLYSPLGFSGGIGGGLGATENTRFDDSVKYENKIGGVSFGAQYKFAGSKNDQGAESAYVAMLAYTSGPVSFKGTYSQTTNTVAWATEFSNVVTPDSNLQIENTKGFMVSGLYNINDNATAKIGYEYTTVYAPSNQYLTSIQLYYGITLPNPAQNMSGDQHFGTFWVGGDYKFTRAFDLAAAYYNINTDNSPEIKKEYRADAYSVLADYTLTKSFDTYAGVLLMHYSGVALEKKAPVLAYSDNAMYGVGLRFKF